MERTEISQPIAGLPPEGKIGFTDDDGRSCRVSWVSIAEMIQFQLVINDDVPETQVVDRGAAGESAPAWLFYLYSTRNVISQALRERIYQELQNYAQEMAG